MCRMHTVMISLIDLVYNYTDNLSMFFNKLLYYPLQYFFSGNNILKALTELLHGRLYKRILGKRLARWSQNSKIVEAFAEHDFRLRRFGEMVRATERARILLCNLPSNNRHTELLTPQSL